MKILMLIDQKYPTEHVFLEEVYSKIFKEKGHQIVWVMKAKDTFQKKIKIGYWNENKVYILPTNNNILLDYFFLIKDLMELKKMLTLKKEKFDLIYVRNDPFMGIFARFFSKKSKIPFVFQLSHLKSEETIYFAKNGLYGTRMKNFILGKISQKLTNFSLKKANLVFPISEMMKTYLIRKGLKQNKMLSLPLGANPKIKVNKHEVEKIKQEYNLKDGNTLVYLGTLIKTRDPVFLFKIIKQLKPDFPKIKLLVVGEGKTKHDLLDYKDYVKKNNLQENIFFIGKVPRWQVPNYLAAADIGLSQFPPVPILKMNSPIKLMEYMNLGLPVVANNYNPEQKLIVTESGGGFCVDYQVEDFCKVIKELVRNDRLRLKMGQKAQNYIRKERNYQKLADKAEKRILSLINDGDYKSL
jgi:glycosyltransferase involved in cell wall biosynthesis